MRLNYLLLGLIALTALALGLGAFIVYLAITRR
jgi:hypothetical protein